MAREMRLVLTDDLDGSEAAETVRFSIDQATYELELSSENAEKLRQTFAPYVAKARRVANTGGRGRRSNSGSGGSGPKRDTAKIREWAQANGYQLGDRGRIPQEIVQAYEAANNG
ncbi:Lsr2 family protein [Brevibacterium sp.]|uniref:histone-like nucleoid-structuring protein Lsr2 n=1 Tax=Brevibacterium sp. TaxID=1701 RepID=UPI002811413B|nr:Lsr2 family protein [Brevibacterium sp.]